MEERLGVALLGRHRRRAMVALTAAAGAAGVVLAVGAAQVPTATSGYSETYHPDPAILSTPWVAALALVAGVLATGYAYCNGGLLVAVAIEAGALLPTAVFADLDVVAQGLSAAALAGPIEPGVETALVTNGAVAGVAATLAVVVGNELRLYVTDTREPWLDDGALAGRDAGLAADQVALGAALATLPLGAYLAVPALGGDELSTAWLVTGLGLLPVAAGSVLARRPRGAVIVLGLAGTLAVGLVAPNHPLLPATVLTAAVLPTAAAARRHGAPVPCMVWLALPLATMAVAFGSPRLTGCQVLAAGADCHLRPVRVAERVVFGATLGAVLGLFGYLLGAGTRRVAPE